MTFTRISFALPLVALLAACGGRTIDPVGSSPNVSQTLPGPTPVRDAGLDTAIAPTGACIEVVITPDELACVHDSDCTETNSGTVCADTCPCGGSAVNNAGASRIAAQVQGLENGECGCPAFGVPTCVNHACTLCGGFMQGPGCAPVDCTFNGTACDGGSEGSTGTEGGSPASDGNTVVAALGATCSPHGASASNQPDNPCSAGYIWACASNPDGSGGASWFQEGVQCNTGPQGSLTTAPCGPGEALFVADPSGDQAPRFNDAGLPVGLASQIYAETAYCVPMPSSCNGTLDCACASTTCSAQGGCGLASGSDACFAAGAGVIDCNCP